MQGAGISFWKERGVKVMGRRERRKS